MEICRGATTLFFPVLVLTALGGCQALQRCQPLPVVVQDAETKQPIAGAEVRVWYPLQHYGQGPREVTSATAGDGSARIKVPANEEAGMMVEAQARGYLSDDMSVPIETVRSLKPASGSQAKGHAPIPVVLELFAEPSPSIELIVPNGYRSIIKVEVRFHEGATFPAGQRCFRYVVSGGAVRVDGPPFFRLISPADYRARYADGTPISSSEDPMTVGLHWLKCDGDDQYFVVGTQSDLDAIRADMKAPPHSRPAQSGGKGGGGGRHRRGGSQGSDS